MLQFYSVFDNLGHIILNYLDFEDAYCVMCVKYMNGVLHKTKLSINNTPLHSWWLTMCDAELNLKYEENKIKDYENYINSEEFYTEMADYINFV